MISPPVRSVPFLRPLDKRFATLGLSVYHADRELGLTCVLGGCSFSFIEAHPRLALPMWKGAALIMVTPGGGAIRATPCIH